MESQFDERIGLGELGIHHFRKHPIWAHTEDTSGVDFAEPHDLVKPIDDIEYDAIFVACSLILHDKTRLDGTVSIDPYRRAVYGIEFFQGETSFHFAGKLLPGTDLEHLQEWLQKKPEEISPLTYITPYQWQDGASIAGEIDLVEWNKKTLQ